ncbi:MAG: hypothetical protein ACREVN_02945 [Gammaproteobacteria bacterium]
MTADRPDPIGKQPRYVIPLVLALLFLGPLALAWYLYFGTPDLRPQESVSHGTLVQPPVPLTALEGPDGPLLRDVWTLVYIGASPCGDPCRKALHDTRQVHRALGRRYDRVGRLYLQAGSDEIPSALRAQHPDLTVMRIDAQDSALLEAFPSTDGTPLNARRIYIVDPLGNLMMFYSPDADPSGLLDDLERLLRLSHIG